MDINGINNSNFNNIDPRDINKNPGGKIQNTPTSNQRHTDADSPSNPDYWQAVSFKGNSEEFDPEAYMKKRLDEISHNKRYDDTFEGRKKETVEKNMHMLSPFGKEAIDFYTEFINRYNDFDECYPRLFFYVYSSLDNPDEKTNKMLSEIVGQVRSFSFKDKDSAANRIAYIKDVMQNADAEGKDKLYWLYLNRYKISSLDGPYKRDDKEFEEIRAFSNLARFFDDEEKDRFYFYNYSPVLSNTIAHNIEKGYFSSDEIVYLADKIESSWSNKDGEKSTFLELMEYVKNNPESAEYFSRINSKRILKESMMPSEIKSFMLPDNPEDVDYLKDLIFYLTEDKKDDPIFYGYRDFTSFADIINPDNLDDFKKLSERKDCNAISDMVRISRSAVNPKTKVFDSSMLAEMDKFKSRKPDFYDNKYIDHASSQVKKCIDMETGKLSPLALSFMDRYFFRDNPSLVDKLKSFKPFKKFIYYRSSDDKIYKSPEFLWHTEYYLDFMKDNNGHFVERNKEALFKMLDRNTYMTSNDFISFLPKLKDENGILDEEKYDAVSKIMKILNGPDRYNYIWFFRGEAKVCEDFLTSYDKLSPDKTKEILQALNSIYSSKSPAPYVNFPAMVEIAYDESGNKIDENFDFMINLMSADKEIFLLDEKTIKIYKDFLNNELNIQDLSFKEKVRLMNELTKLRASSNLTNDDLIGRIDKTLAEIDSVLNSDNISLSVSKEAKNKFIVEVLSSKNLEANGLSEFENTIKDSIPELKKMNKGLPLTYTKAEFLSDLSKLCDTKEKKDILSSKTEITLSLSNNSEKIEGYEGIINLHKLNRNDEFENSIYEICHKFFYENKINTGDKKLDEALNTIIKAAPEFINTIGKKQHGTHNYALDIHQLLVLANSINNPDYKNLNNMDKTMLKISAIFHDIAKQENTIDKGHQIPSSLYARSIIKKFFNNADTKDRVYELIKNHHWLEEFANAEDKEQISKDLAYRFRRPNDFEIAKIMARADLMAVSDEFYNEHKNALKDKNLDLIQKNLDYFYSTGSVIISDYFIDKKSLQNHIETHNGVEYQVVDFHKIKDDEDLGQYGFMRGRTKKDVQFLVHMVDTKNAKKNLTAVKHLSSPVNGGVLSESLITPYYKRTYENRKYGLILSQINANVMNAKKINQGSGYEKDLSSINYLVFGENAEARKNFRHEFLLNLGIDPDGVSDKEFGEFYKNNIIAKSSFNQFVSGKEYTLGTKTITGEDIKQAIIKFQDSLIDKKEQNHNEIVGYVPKLQAVVAKERSLSSIPDEILEFAKENNLPVVLI